MFINPFTSCFLYHSIIYDESFFKSIKEEGFASFGCVKSTVYIAESQEWRKMKEAIKWKHGIIILCKNV